MRVLTVGNMYPPQHLGGYELVWRSAVRHLRERGDGVRVLTTDFSTGAAEPDDPDVHRELRWYWRDHAFPRLSLRARLALERHNAEVLDRHLRDLRPDVVTWWSMGGMSLSLLERVRRRGLPAVAFVHDDWLIYGPRVDAWLRLFARRPRLGAAVERRTGIPTRVELDEAARYVFVSETTRRRALASGLAPGESAVAPSGIDAELFAAPAPMRDWRRRLLYVGRIDERKGIAEAIAALARLPGETTLVVVGDGDPACLRELRDRAERLGVLARVEFIGMRPRDELPALYADADAIVFPVRWEEPWGLVPLESMAMGRPVVASGRGGSGEYLGDGRNCLLFPAGDDAALAAAVRRLAGDPALRERLRRGGLDTARHHTEQRFNERVAAAVDAAAGAPLALPG